MSEYLFSIFPNERYVDLTLYQHGWEKCESLHSYGPAIRNHYLFHYIISGKGILESNNSQDKTIKYHLSQGKGFLITPTQVNTYYADKDNPWEYVWVEFDGIHAEEFLERAGLTLDQPIYTPKKSEFGNTLYSEMLYIAQHGNESSLNLIGHLYLAIDILIKSSATTPAMRGGNLKDFYIREAISFIEQNYKREITIEDIAQCCNLNRSYFGKIFKDTLQITPQEFLIHYRMTKAVEMLKFTNMNIKDISMAVGYQNQLHFSRAFKKEYSISPKEWRKQNI